MRNMQNQRIMYIMYRYLHNHRDFCCEKILHDHVNSNNALLYEHFPTLSHAR